MKNKPINPDQATRKVANKWRLAVVFLTLVALLGATNDDVIFRDSFENHAPEITSIPGSAAEIDLLYTYDVVATDAGSDLLLYELTVSPDNMTIGEFSGEVRWIPDQLGVFAVELQVFDGNGGAAQQQWEIEVLTFLDSDDDGLSDDEEVNVYATNPLKFDSDDDGFGDGTEILAGTNPLDPDDFPGGAQDPEVSAPDPDPTVATTISDYAEFLYTGDNPIQTGVVEGTINPVRAAVVRGRVLERNSAPLADVTITVRGHPEYGQTVSRANGMFDMVVNGGGYLVINYNKSGYLPAQRQLAVPSQDYIWVPEVVLIPPDPVVTPVIMGATEMQAARGSVITDSDGSRQATLLFQPGTTAELLMPDGSTQAVNSLHIRATEYSAGPDGPNSMPAELPPESAYTYCVELSADEAVAKVNGKDVLFNQPVPFYVDNFIGFPVGENVPLGYYDNDRSAWIPTDNGRVIEVLAIAGALAVLDVDGDGVADTGEAISDLGITDDERQQLAVLYQAGDTLWRMQLTHLSTWDANWGVFPPDDAVYPDQNPPLTDDTSEQSCQVGGSIIECQNQVLGEQIPVVGTPFTLNYRSHSVPGRTEPADFLTIFLSGNSVPDSLLGINLVVEVAGRRFTQSFGPSPNQSTQFNWDGLDAYDRKPAGVQPMVIRIGYRYQGQYRRVDRFGYNAGGTITGNESRDRLTLWQTINTSLKKRAPNAAGLGSWALDVHHTFSPTSQVLYRGDGGRQGGQWQHKNKIVSLEASPEYWSILSLAVTSDGSVYFITSSWARGYIFRVDRDGIVTLVAGAGDDRDSEGIPAIDAILDSPDGLVISPDGILYFSDTGGHRVRKIDDEGRIWTVVGTGEAGISGDGGPAGEARLHTPQGLAFGQDGSLYIADRFPSPRVRRVDPSGIISLVAGGGSSQADGIPATEANLSYIYDVAVGPDGSLYISSSGLYKVFRVNPSGIISTVLTTRGNFRSVAVGMDGSVYATDGVTIQRRDSGGAVSNYVGTGGIGCYVDGSLASGTMTTPWDVAIGPEGDVYGVSNFIAGYGGCPSVFKVTSVLPGFSGTDLAIPSEDGALLYKFSAVGRHLQTLNTLTGAMVYEFAYNPEGLLTTVSDGDGNITTIERDGEGNPTAIVGPYGQRTNLTLDANGYLATITNPASEVWQFGYTDGGLLTSSVDPNAHTSTYTYDSLGRLVQTRDAASGGNALVRTELEDGYEVSRTTAMGRTTTYRVERLPTGDKRWLNTAPNGMSVESLFKTDGSQTTTLPDGTVVAIVQGPDPRFGMQSPVVNSLDISTPGGLTQAITMSRTATLSNLDDPLSLTSKTDTMVVNGKTLISSFDAVLGQITTTTPTGRQLIETLDNQGRIVSRELNGLSPTFYEYDLHGRLTDITFGSGDTARTWAIGYDTDGHVATVTDPLSQTSSLEYDTAGRLNRQVTPDSREILLDHDYNGNLTAITPPGRPAHVFDYSAVDLLEDHIPPDGDANGGLGPWTTAWSFDPDRQRDEAVRPDGVNISFGYDTAGRLQQLTTDRGVSSFSYDPSHGYVSSMSTPEGNTLSFSYDASLVTDVTWAGEVAGSIVQEYDNHFRTISRSISGHTATPFAYDDDGLLTNAGAMSLDRDAGNGLITGSTLGNVLDSLTYNEFGEIENYVASFDAIPQYSVQLVRDKLGRIVERTETISGTARVYEYVYDLVGRLEEVKIDSSTVSTYTYDTNGNRLSNDGVTGSYDDQDRLLQYGNIEYVYTARGHMETRADSGLSQTTTYGYDAYGNLMEVTLPDGMVVEYVVDALNRRIGKKVDGTPTHAWLYKDDLNPVVELDGAGAVLSVFIYASKRNVPDYMLRGGNTYRIVSDHLGSPRMVIDTVTGIVEQQMEFDEFGKVLQDSNPGFQPFGFAGGLYDPDTQLVRFGARDYDPSIGRWTARDPTLFDGKHLNLYSYAASDPVNFVDPGGLRITLGDLTGLISTARDYWGRLAGLEQQAENAAQVAVEMHGHLTNTSIPREEQGADILGCGLRAGSGVAGSFLPWVGGSAEQIGEMAAGTLEAGRVAVQEYIERHIPRLRSERVGEDTG